MPPIGGEPGEIGTEDLNESAPDDPCDETGSGGDSDNTLSDPVNLSTGEFTLKATDLVIPGRGFDFVLKRTYRSRTFSLLMGGYGYTLDAGAIMGFNWDMSYNIFLVSKGNTLVFHDGTGRSDTFTLIAGSTNTYGRDEYFRTITLNPDETFTMLHADGTRWEFAPLNNMGTTSKITAVVDRNGNTMTFEYETLPDDGDGVPYQGLLTMINDTLDSVTEISGGPQLHTRSISFHYDDVSYPTFLTSVTDWFGRTVTYEYDANRDLISVTTPAVTGTPNGNDFLAGKTTNYAYGNGISEPVFFCDQWVVECDEFEPPFCWWVCQPGSGSTFDVTRGLLNHNLIGIFDAKGQLILQNFYDPAKWANNPNFDRVTLQIYGNQALGNRFHFVYVPLTPALENNWAKRKTIDNNRMGQVMELFYDDKNRLVMRRDYTGLAPLPTFPTTDTSNRPENKLRAGDPDYFETRYDYDNNSRKTKITHPNGNFEEFFYDTTNPDRRFHGNLLSHTWNPGPLGGDQPSSITESFTYETGLGSCCGFNFVKTHTDGRKNDFNENVTLNDTVNDYDPNGNRIQTTHRDDGVENWTYNGFGQVLTHTLLDNGSGHRRVDKYTYYPIGHPSYGYLEKKIVDDGGLALTTTYEYDAVGNVTKKTDPRGNATEYVVNQLNQVVQETSRPVQTINPDGTIGPATVGYVRSTFYDENDNIVRVDIDNVDEAGNAVLGNPRLTTAYEYDFLNFMTRKTEEVDAGNNIDTLYGYNKNKKLTLVLYGEAINGNQLNNTVSGVYDERNLLFTVTRAAGDADQSTTQYDYDGNKNLVTITQGTEDTIAPRISIGTYDGYNRLVTSTDANGNIVTHHYDANHNRTSARVDGELWDVVGSAGNVQLSETTYAYDPEDRATQVDVAFFDAAGAPINIPGDSTPGLSRTTIAYSDNSQILSVTDDGDNKTTAIYDTANRRSVITDPKTNTITYAYDANSNVIQVKEDDKSDLVGGTTESFTTTYDYDNLDRLIQKTDNIGNAITYGYDSRNNRVLIVDALGHQTRYNVTLQPCAMSSVSVAQKRLGIRLAHLPTSC